VTYKITSKEILLRIIIIIIYSSIFLLKKNQFQEEHLPV